MEVERISKTRLFWFAIGLTLLILGLYFTYLSICTVGLESLSKDSSNCKTSDFPDYIINAWNTPSVRIPLVILIATILTLLIIPGLAFIYLSEKEPAPYRDF